MHSDKVATPARILSPLPEVALAGGSPTSPYRWTMLAALWFTYFCFGLVNGSLAPLIVRIGEDLALSPSALGLIMGAWALVYIVAAMPSGAAIDRFGTRAGIATGILLIAASGLARSAAGDFWTLFVSVAIFGLGGPLISVGAPKVIAQWFSESERGTAMGIYMTGPYLGTALAFATANSVLMPLFDGNWRLTLGAFSLFALVATTGWILVAREPASRTRDAKGGTACRGVEMFGELMRVELVRAILLCTLVAFMFSHGLMAWLPTILAARGLDVVSAGIWASVPTLLGVASNLIIPRFATPQRDMAILAALYGCLVLATLLLAFAEGALLMLGLMLLGIARIIGTIMLLILMQAPRVGAANMGAATGLYFTIGEVGGVIGPTLLGAVVDLTGSYVSSVLTLNALAVFLVVMMLPLRRARERSGSTKRPSPTHSPTVRTHPQAPRAALLTRSQARGGSVGPT